MPTCALLKGHCTVSDTQVTVKASWPFISVNQHDGFIVALNRFVYCLGTVFRSAIWSMGIIFTISMFIAHPRNNMKLIVGIFIVIEYAHFVFSCQTLDINYKG